MVESGESGTLDEYGDPVYNTTQSDAENELKLANSNGTFTPDVTTSEASTLIIDQQKDDLATKNIKSDIENGVVFPDGVYDSSSKDWTGTVNVVSAGNDVARASGDNWTSALEDGAIILDDKAYKVNTVSDASNLTVFGYIACTYTGESADIYVTDFIVELDDFYDR